MNQPTDNELLDALDRRAAAARAELDLAVDRVDVPGHGFTPSTRRSIPRPIWLAAAAAVVVIALVGAVALRSGGDDESTIAGQPTVAHLALADPAGDGFELTAAFDGSEGAPEGVELMDVSVTVQGPADADDPWAASVLEYALPAEVTTLDGEPIDLDGPEATYTTDGVAPTVGWVEGDRVRYLVSTRLARVELVDLARRAVAAGSEPGAPLPGQRTLFAGTISDALPTISTSLALPPDLSGVVYREIDGDNALVVATRAGDDRRWRATFAAASSVERITVRGRDAVIAHFLADGSLTEVSWLEADGTLVRAGTAMPMDSESLASLLDGLEAIDDDAFAALVRDHPLEFSDGSSSVDSGAEPATETTQPARGELATVSQSDGESFYGARVVVDENGGFTLEVEATSASDGSGVGAPISDLRSNRAVRHHLDDGSLVVAGLIEPHQGGLGLLDASSGDAVGFEGGSTATLQESDHVLFLIVVPPGSADRQLVIVATATDGSQIRIPA